MPGTFEKPILLAEPSIHVRKLCAGDSFLIFASDGLWEHLSNQEAVDIVQAYPRNVRYLFIDFELAVSFFLSGGGGAAAGTTTTD